MQKYRKIYNFELRTLPTSQGLHFSTEKCYRFCHGSIKLLDNWAINELSIEIIEFSVENKFFMAEKASETVFLDQKQSKNSIP